MMAHVKMGLVCTGELQNRNARYFPAAILDSDCGFDLIFSGISPEISGRGEWIWSSVLCSSIFAISSNPPAYRGTTESKV